MTKLINECLYIDELKKNNIQNNIGWFKQDGTLRSELNTITIQTSATPETLHFNKQEFVLLDQIGHVRVCQYYDDEENTNKYEVKRSFSGDCVLKVE